MERVLKRLRLHMKPQITKTEFPMEWVLYTRRMTHLKV
jgi:hypothetical protein